jgi:preprotein translocase subunit SecE
MPDDEPDSPTEDYWPSRREVLIDRAIIVGTTILILVLVGAVILLIRSSL